MSIRLQNIGCNTWGTGLRLGTWNPIPGQDQPSTLGGALGCPTVTDWAACNRIAPTAFNIAYGQIATFAFTVRGQSSTGTSYVYLRPLIEGVTWMEDQGVYMQVNTLICTDRSPHDDAARYVITSAPVPDIRVVSSSILEYDPFYTAFNITGTFANVMLANVTSTQWAQLGWAKHAQNGPTAREVFVEFFLSPTQNYWQFWPGEPLGTETWYQIQYTPPAVFDFYVRGAHRKQHVAVMTPTQYQVFGETHDRVDQMPGGVNAHVRFVNTQYSVGGQWVFVTSPITSSESYHAGTNPSLARYEIWDTACAN